MTDTSQQRRILEYLGLNSDAPPTAEQLTFGEANEDDSPRSISCQYPDPGNWRCGQISTYVHDQCSGEHCCRAWADHQADYRETRQESEKVYDYDHGTLACAREGCQCHWCEQAERALGEVMGAEDAVFGHEPNRVSSYELKNGHGVATWDGHGVNREGSRKGCRCIECRFAGSYTQLERRLGSIPATHKRSREFFRLQAERMARVEAWIAKHGFLRDTTYAMLWTPPKECATRNRQQAEARRLGYARYTPYAEKPWQTYDADYDPEKRVVEAQQRNADLDHQRLLAGF